MLENTTVQKTRAMDWFRKLRDQICHEFESIEDEYVGNLIKIPPGRFKRTSWDRTGGGGGLMSIMKGRVFEKVGVNFSEVEGEFPSDFVSEIRGTSKDPHFWACGISVVAHMQSPLVPAVHMNTRHLITTTSWFGGGSDLTPIFENKSDTVAFHNSFQEVCDKYDPSYYQKFKKWCDEYFYLPHRKEHRGVGGIFFDNLNSNNWEKDFSFTQDIGKAFLNVYPSIVRKHMNKPWNIEQRKTQLIKRGRYVEFNLLYDKGTRFGLKTNGNIDAIFMSLPPTAEWG